MGVPEELRLLAWLSPWLSPWEPAEPGLEAELAREVGRGHPLAGRNAVSVGRRTDNDDVLLYLPEGSEPLAVVHLTWSGRRERDPRWPSTTLNGSVPAWASECMRRDHRESQEALEQGGRFGLRRPG